MTGITREGRAERERGEHASWKTRKRRLRAAVWVPWRIEGSGNCFKVGRWSGAWRDLDCVLLTLPDARDQ